MPVTLECVLENTGSASAVNPSAVFQLPGGPVSSTAGHHAEHGRVAPGRTLALKTRFAPGRQTPALSLAVRASADKVDGELTAETTLVVGPATVPPSATGRLRATTTGDSGALLENDRLRLVFRRNEFGFGPGELLVASGTGWHTVGWLPRLGRLVLQDGEGARREHVVLADRPPEVNSDGPASLEFVWRAPDCEQSGCRVRIRFELAENEKSISAQHELTCEKPCKLLAFDGPMLYAVDRDEAVFPGLEWLV